MASVQFGLDALNCGAGARPVVPLDIKDLEAKFVRDLAQLARADLARSGYGPGRKDTDESVLLRFHNVSRRIPPQIPWKVHISKEASGKALPPAEAAGLRDLIAKARNGDSLRPWLHEAIDLADYRDLMLNHWSIHHFHLGPHRPGDRFAGRTDLLAFVMFVPKEQAMYVIDVETHDVGFLKQDLLAIIERNWPHVLDPWTLRGLNVSGNYTDPELTALVEAGVNVTTLTPGGRAIAGIGGGMVATKEALNDRRAVDVIQARVRSVAVEIVKNLAEYEGRLGLTPGTLRPILVEYGDRIVVADENTGKRIAFVAV